MAEEVCRLLLLVSQEEGALLARQHPGLLGQAALHGGANSSSPPAHAPAPGPGSAPDAVAQPEPAAPAAAASAAPAQYGQPAHLPMAPGPLQNGPSYVAAAVVGQQPAAQTAAPAQPGVPLSAATASGSPAQSPAAPAVRSPPTVPPGAAVNGAYQRAIQAANQQVRRTFKL